MSKLFAPPAARGAKEALDPWLKQIFEKDEGRRARYRRDPFALADDGLASIVDLETSETVPLVLWDHQREVIATWIDLDSLKETGRVRFRNVHEEKSRQMGLTWIVAYIVTWALNFTDARGLALSQKLGEICDSGPTIDSFFGRVKFIHDSLPEDLRMKLVFTGGNDPSIRQVGGDGFLTGEGANLDPGRGGKYDFIFLDEAARIPWGRIIQTAVTRACPNGRFYNSTPKGEDPLYFWLRDTRPKGYTFLRHHWSVNPYYAEGIHIAAFPPDPDTKEPGRHAGQHSKAQAAAATACELCKGTISGLSWDASNPRAHRYPGRLTSPWYEDAIVELTDEQVAQELDIDYAGSLPARIYTEFSQERNVVPHIPFEPSLPLELCIDYGWGMTSIGVFQETPNEYRMIAEFEGANLRPDEVVAGLKGVLRGIGVEEKNLAAHNTLTWLMRGDPAGEATQMQTGRPIVADYRRLGFNISSRPYSIDWTVLAVKRLLMGRPKILLFSESTCPRAIKHVKMNKWETDRLGVRKPNAKPQNDEHNHLMRAVAYLVTHKFPPPATRQGPGIDEPRGETGKIDAGIGYDMDF